MRREKIKFIISWSLVIICMAVIFLFSSHTAAESAQQSSAVLQWIIKIFGENEITDFIVRKLAHFLEYTGLSLLLANAFYQTFNRNMFFYSVLTASLYAVTDEFHQLFVEGRACRFADWGIDTAGAILGAAAFTVILIILKSLVNRKEINIDRKNN